MIENLLGGIEVRLGEDYLQDKAKWDGMAKKVVYTGPIDAYSTIVLVLWSIVLFVLRRSYWTSQTSKEMLLSITQTEKHRGPASLNTNGLSLVRMKMEMIYQRRLLVESTVLSGNQEMNLTIRSMMRRTVDCTRSTRTWQIRKKT